MSKVAVMKLMEEALENEINLGSMSVENLINAQVLLIKEKNRETLCKYYRVALLADTRYHEIIKDKPENKITDEEIRLSAFRVIFKKFESYLNRCSLGDLSTLLTERISRTHKINLDSIVKVLDNVIASYGTSLLWTEEESLLLRRLEFNIGIIFRQSLLALVQGKVLDPFGFELHMPIKEIKKTSNFIK